MTAILALDAATGPCSAAIWKDGRIAAYVENRRPSVQSAALLPMVEQALAQASLGYHDLERIACTTGPGSFTGIRVALATARGIAFAAKLPGLGFTTLETLAFAATREAAQAQRILAILNAGKGEWYYQYFTPAGQPLTPALLGALATALAASDGVRTLVAGNAPVMQAGFIASTIAFPRADALAGLVALHGAAACALAPFYIRAPDAKLPANP